MCFCCNRSALLDRMTSGLADGMASRRDFLAGAALAAAGGAAPRRAFSTDAAPVAATDAATDAVADPPRGDAAAPIVFRGGVIRPLTTRDAGGGRGEPVEALAVRGSTILAVGAADRVMAAAGTAARVVDLGGRTVVPGLIDPHHHAVLAAVLSAALRDVGPATCRTRADVVAALSAAAAATPPGGWIAAGFFDNLLQGGDLTGTDLDAVSTRHPIFVLHVNGHVGAANAAAFARAGIPADVGVLPGGGRFGRGADGRLDGRIFEQPALMRFIAVAAPPPTPEGVAAAVVAYAKRATAAGLTTLHEPGTIKPGWVERLARLSGEIGLRLSASFSTDELLASRAFSGLAPRGRARRIPGTLFSLYGIKFWADGSNQARSAAQTRPYLGGDEKGQTNHTRAEMTALCREVREAGWSILVHCQGDAAIDDALDAIEAAYGPHPDTGINRIEHATMARGDQLARNVGRGEAAAHRGSGRPIA